METTLAFLPNIGPWEIIVLTIVGGGVGLVVFIAWLLYRAGKAKGLEEGAASGRETERGSGNT